MNREERDAFRVDIFKDRVLLVLTILLLLVGTVFIFVGLSEGNGITVSNDREADAVRGEIQQSLHTITGDLATLEHAV